MNKKISSLLFLMTVLSISIITAQPVTGVWKGKIDRKNVELKIIKNGDSLTGTSYYYESANSYRRYSIKGYFDDRDNSVVWWDDQLIEAKNGKGLFSQKPVPYLSTADFNCPGGTTMYLNGKAVLKEKEEQEKGSVALQKITIPVFKDEWDFIIENYTLGANDPQLIDSVGQLAFTKPPLNDVTVVAKPQQKLLPEKEIITPEKRQPVIRETKPKPVVAAKPAPNATPVVTAAPLNNEQKFTSRKKVITQEIPVSGDSIELRFYDNAEVDGDSIAVFLNNQLLYQHILLTEKAYIIKLPVASLQQVNELVMVAENLGSIPPNTSLMVALVNGQRYEARLESTEQSNAAIRFVRQDL